MSFVVKISTKTLWPSRPGFLNPLATAMVRLNPAIARYLDRLDQWLSRGVR